MTEDQAVADQGLPDPDGPTNDYTDMPTWSTQHCNTLITYTDDGFVTFIDQASGPDDDDFVYDWGIGLAEQYARNILAAASAARAASPEGTAE